MRVLVIEDNPKMAAAIKKGLQEKGYAADGCHSGFEGEDLAAIEPYDAILLDLMLPDRDGVEICRNLRRRSIATPILMLTALSTTEDKVAGLDAGADDYVTKPFWPEELLARVRARLRRPDLVRGDGTTRVVGAIVLDAGKREVRVDGTIIELTKAELDVLEALARRAGSAVTRAALVNEALDPERGTERTLDVHISRLRKKLGSAGAQITTVWGIGYKLVSGVP